jgi:hypothetical protein
LCGFKTTGCRCWKSHLQSDERRRAKGGLRYCDAIIDNPMRADDEMWEERHRRSPADLANQPLHQVHVRRPALAADLHTRHGNWEFMKKRQAENKGSGAGERGRGRNRDR